MTPFIFKLSVPVENEAILRFALTLKQRSPLLHIDKNTWPSPSSLSYSIITLSSSSSSSSTAVESSDSVSSSTVSYSDSRVPSVVAFGSPCSPSYIKICIKKLISEIISLAQSYTKKLNQQSSGRIFELSTCFTCMPTNTYTSNSCKQLKQIYKLFPFAQSYFLRSFSNFIVLK